MTQLEDCTDHIIECFHDPSVPDEDMPGIIKKAVKDLFWAWIEEQFGE